MLTAMAEGKGDPSGMIVHPKLPVPSNRASEPRVKGFGGDDNKKKLALAGGVLAAIAIGGAVGYLVAPNQKDELSKAQKELAAAKAAVSVEKDRADGASQRLTVLEKDKSGLETKLSEVSARAGEMEKKALDANSAAEKKLQAAIDKTQGTVSAEGDEIRLKLVDKVLFAVGDDQLTDKGKAVLDKVGKALAEMPDKQVWVQGHTDDQPIVVPPPKKDPKAKKGAKPEVPVVRFATNWELSAARALQVVHYLQDKVKLDPTRLAALAFSQYRPVSKTNKAANRRIEIVLYPHKAVIERAKPAKK